ncbi:hypothetical protein D3C78_1240610 [compost metagenome]
MKARFFKQHTREVNSSYLIAKFGQGQRMSAHAAADIQHLGSLWQSQPVHHLLYLFIRILPIAMFIYKHIIIAKALFIPRLHISILLYAQASMMYGIMITNCTSIP